jgi:calcineurin-like phosphoesterase family protein
MNDIIIDNWNSIVKPENTVFHLGDFALGWEGNSKKECYKELLSQLNGKKILIKGNHDKETDKFYLDIGFEKVYKYYVFDKTLFIHYPLITNDYYMSESEKNFINQMKNYYKINNLKRVIHGHTHNSNTGLSNHYNVSVENINYTPIHSD